MWSGYPWPGSSFFVDDVLNQQLADRHGIVISTSHHEPMHRSTTEWRRAPKGPYSWDENKDSLTEFFNTGAKRAHPYESVLTLGMRGVGDDEIDAIDAQATMKNVIDGQRDIIEKVYGMPDGVQRMKPMAPQLLKPSPSTDCSQRFWLCTRKSKSSMTED